jgi:hypothetical protein
MLVAEWKMWASVFLSKSGGLDRGKGGTKGTLSLSWTGKREGKEGLAGEEPAALSLGCMVRFQRGLWVVFFLLILTIDRL